MKIPLRHPVLAVDMRNRAASLLGISIADVKNIAHEVTAWRDGRLLDDLMFRESYPDDDFYSFTGAGQLPAECLVTEITTPRDPNEYLSPPIESAEALAVELVELQARLHQLESFNAPSVLLSASRRAIQQAYDSYATTGPDWCSMGDLMTGSPPDPGIAGTPETLYPFPWDEAESGTTPLDCSFVGENYFIQFRYVSFVVSPAGVVVDYFPTCGIRVVASNGPLILFARGGGAAATTGYFDAKAYLRDTASRRWMESSEVNELPKYVAGTVGDVKWSIVVDYERGRGYRLSPHTVSDMCGDTFNSACGNFVWDGGLFVKEAASGAVALDARSIPGDLVCFAKGPQGWRFVTKEAVYDDDLEEDELEEDELQDGEESPPVRRLLDEMGNLLREIPPDVLAVGISDDGLRMLEVTERGCRECATDSGLATTRLSLEPFQQPLQLPEISDTWARLCGVYGVPAEVAGVPLQDAKEAIRVPWQDELEHDELQRAILLAKDRPPIPGKLPRL